MATKHSCPESSVEYELKLIDIMGERNYKVLKVVKNFAVSVAILAMGMYALSLGADPTVVAVMTISGLLALNGVEMSEWLAVRERLRHERLQEDDES